MSGVTQILAAIERGEPQAASQLLPLVYDELRRLARQKLSHEKPGQTLQATALVHEAYVRLVGPAGLAEPKSPDNVDSDGKSHRAGGTYTSRGHFFAAAAEAMRRILVEAARRKKRLKRGGDLARQPLDEDQIAMPESAEDLEELDAALDRLAAKDQRKAELVKLRFFAGLTQEQAAEALGIGVSTADRDWSYARAWLFREIAKGGAGAGG